MFTRMQSHSSRGPATLDVRPPQGVLLLATSLCLVKEGGSPDLAGGRLLWLLVIKDVEDRPPILPSPSCSFFQKDPLPTGQCLFPLSESREGPGLHKLG